MPSPLRLAVYVQPRASRNEVVGWHDGALKLRLTAPPVEGAANDALQRFVAELLGVPRRQVRLLSGQGSRRKLLQIDGVGAEALARIAGRAPVPAAGGPDAGLA